MDKTCTCHDFIVLNQDSCQGKSEIGCQGNAMTITTITGEGNRLMASSSRVQ